MAIKPIQILINAKDDASAVFDKLQNKVAAVGAAILGYFGIQAFAGVVKGAADLESGLSRVQAATNASSQEMQQLRATAEAAGSSTKFTAVEAAGALENLAKAGLSAKDAMTALPAVLQLAQAGDVDLATSAEFVTKAINGMGLAFTDAGRVADVLAKGANATNTSVAGLAQALSYAAPLANTLGISLESTVAIIGKFADAGIDASRAGTALNSILAQFSDPASKFRVELAAAGITTTNFEAALHQLAKAGPIGERAIAAVGQEAGPALRALLNQGVGKLDELTKALQDAKGSAAETAQIMQANLNGSLQALGSSWDTLKNALATPILPVLQKGVEQLTGSLKAAIADGTVGRFGQALATGFQSAITWARNFAASVNWGDLVARMNAFASEAQQTFDRIGQWVTNAGNVVKTAYGVMAAGTNVVLSIIYKLGQAWAEVAANIQSGLGTLMEWLSKISFGGVSAAFKSAAEEIRLSAGGTAAAANALGKKAGEAFDAAADAARLAQEGFAGLASATDDAAKTAVGTSSVMTTVAVELARAGDAAAAASAKTGAAASKQAEAADAARASVATLRAEYQKEIATGNVQRAAEVLVQLRQATDAAATAAEKNTQKQQEQAKAIEAAFARMGIQTKEALRVAAEVARQDFETIRDSGQATADAIAAAWAKAAQAAIDANEGVVPSWVEGEAAVKGYAVQVDAAGKATLELVRTSAALKGLVGGYDAAAAAAGRYTQSLQTPGPGSLPGSRGGGGPNRGRDQGFNQAEQNRRDGYSDQNVFIVDHNAARAAELAASAAAAQADREKRLGGQNAVDASLQFQLRDKLKAGALSAADLESLIAVSRSLDQQNQVNGYAMQHGALSTEGIQSAREWQNLNAQFKEAIQRLSAPSSMAAAAQHVTINIPGLAQRTVRTDSEGAGNLEALLRELATAKGVAN